MLIIPAPACCAKSAVNEQDSSGQGRYQGVFAVLCLFLLSVLQPVEAYDGGDAVALLLGMAITVVGFCVCLGWYSRRRSGQF
ncbi:hypothetical protein C0J50_22458 [Silurus asotus]|uniref:Uncharacterized protein n=1 Tax=Silurus asotus TaxID=30991 RepID=A0AAD5AJF9_SILAS|nr:hypothetical protein C0J50_22458 [Silurus asotus]